MARSTTTEKSRTEREAARTKAQAKATGKQAERAAKGVGRQAEATAEQAERTAEQAGRTAAAYLRDTGYATLGAYDALFEFWRRFPEYVTTLPQTLTERWQADFDEYVTRGRQVVTDVRSTPAARRAQQQSARTRDALRTAVGQNRRAAEEVVEAAQETVEAAEQGVENVAAKR